MNSLKQSACLTSSCCRCCCCRDVGGEVHYNFTHLDMLVELLWINGLRPGDPSTPDPQPAVQWDGR